MPRKAEFLPDRLIIMPKNANEVDAAGVRCFPYARSKQLARFIKPEYEENILHEAIVPMNARIMNSEPPLPNLLIL